MNALRPSRLHDVTRDYAPGEVVREPVFWLMYLLFVLVGAGGLMATAQLSVIATDFGVAKTPVSLLFLTMPALTFALAIDRVLNGLTRPFFGWVSDRIGRENTMFIAFLLEGLGILVLVQQAANPVAFVVLTGVVFFAWGEIYSLFPATCGDTFGRRFAATNYGAAVHRQRHCRVAGAARQPAAGGDGHLAGSALRGRGREPAGRPARSAGPEAAPPWLHRPFDDRAC